MQVENTLELAKAYAAIARDITFVGALIMVLFGGARKVWVWGWALAECRADYEERLTTAVKERDEWKVLALEGRYITKTAIDLAKKRGS